MDPSYLHVNDDCAIFKVQVHVSAKVRFGSIDAEAFHAASPLDFLVSYFVPALLADRKFFAFYLDIEFDVFALTVVFPGVFTMLHVFCLRAFFWFFSF